MAVSFKTGVFTMNTGTGNQGVTGVGFQPAAVLFYSTPQQTADAAIDVSAKLMMGAAVSSSARWAHAIYDVDGGPSGDCQTRFTAGKCLLDIDNTGAVLWAADFVSLDSDGFTINVTTAPASAFRVYYLAFGGSITANTGTLTLPTAGATLAETGVGFMPDCLVAAYGAFAQDTGESHAKWGVGVAADSTGGTTQSAYCVGGEDLVGTSDKGRGAQSATFIYAQSPTAFSVDAAATVSSWDSDGFTLAISDNPTTAIEVGYLALQGLSAKVVNDTKPTTPTTKATTGVGFQPEALLAFSVMSTSANQTAGSVSSHNSLGTTTGTSAHGGVYTLQIDNAGTEDSSSWNDDSAILNAFNNTTGSTTLMRGVLSSFDSDGFTLNYTSSDASAYVVYFLALGEPGAQVYTKSGFGVAGLVGAGTSASLFAETGFGKVGADGYGAKEFIGAVVYVKTGFGVVGLVGAGTKSVTPAGGTHTKTGFGKVGTAAAGGSTLHEDVVPFGVSIAFGASSLDPYPPWVRIDPERP